MNDMLPSIAVLGASGRVGRLLPPAFEFLGVRQTVLFQSRKEGPHIDWVAEEANIFGGLSDQRLETVVCLWGDTSGGGGAANTDLAMSCIEAARRAGVPRVVLMSSAAVYSGFTGSGLSEELEVAPRSSYGRSKLDMEQAVLRMADGSGPELFILRLANVIGADALAQGRHAASRDRPLLLDRFPSGAAPRRSYASPVTLARLFTEIGRRPVQEGKYHLLNMADGGATFGMDDLLLAWDSAGASVPWVWKAAPEGALPELGIATGRLQTMFPAIVPHFCRSAQDLVRDWRMVERGQV